MQKADKQATTKSHLLATAFSLRSALDDTREIQKLDVGTTVLQAEQQARQQFL